MTIIFVILGCKSKQPLSEKQITRKNYQEVIGDTTNVDPNPDTFAMYPNGKKGITDHIVQNLKYPLAARQAGIEGQVIVSYIVEKDGMIKETKIIQSIHPELDNEAIRIILSMDRWIPGYKDGNPVRVEYYQPFNFRLN